MSQSNLKKYVALCNSLRDLRESPQYTRDSAAGLLKELDDLWSVMNEAEHVRSLDRVGATTAPSSSGSST